MTKEELGSLKEDLANAKAELRQFKREHGIRKPESLEEGEIKDQFEELQSRVDAIETALEEAVQELKEANKGTAGNGGAKYPYPQIADATSGELRDMTSVEKKKWRTHARKEAKKAGIKPEEVEFDPNYFLPRVKVEKAPKEKKSKKVDGVDDNTETETEAGTERVKKPRRVKPVVSETDEE